MSDGSETLVLVDSIDHVLSATDADNFGRGGVRSVVPGRLAARRAALGWGGKGLERFVMYTGAGHAQRQVHDTVAKVRVTGFLARKATISPATKVEFQDENGDWKAL